MRTMKSLLVVTFFTSTITTLSLSDIAPAHEGGTKLDSLGCHHGRNHRDYHCHKGLLEGMTFKSKGEAIRNLNRIRAAKEKEQEDDDGK